MDHATMPGVQKPTPLWLWTVGAALLALTVGMLGFGPLSFFPRTLPAPPLAWIAMTAWPLVAVSVVTLIGCAMIMGRGWWRLWPPLAKPFLITCLVALPVAALDGMRGGVALYPDHLLHREGALASMNLAAPIRVEPLSTIRFVTIDCDMRRKRYRGRVAEPTYDVTFQSGYRYAASEDRLMNFGSARRRDWLGVIPLLDQTARQAGAQRHVGRIDEACVQRLANQMPLEAQGFVWGFFQQQAGAAPPAS